MGWNTLDQKKPHALLDGLTLGPQGLHAYFVHSFALNPQNSADLVAQADYGGPVTAIVGRDNHGRHPIPSGKEPEARARADREFPEVEAVILFPAIDLKDGLCVRLEQGDMSRATVFHRDPAEQAYAFERAGFEYLHIVDLDGAFAGKPVNAEAVERILEATNIPVQLGGGIRDMATVEGWLDKGVNRVIIGTAAVRDPDLVREAAQLSRQKGRGRARRARRQGRGQGLGGILGTHGARDRAAVRGCRGVRHHLYRHCARRHAKGPQSRRHHRAGRCGVDAGHCLGRARLDRRREGADVEPRAHKLEGAIAGRALYDGRLDAGEALGLIKAARSAA